MSSTCSPLPLRCLRQLPPPPPLHSPPLIRRERRGAPFVPGNGAAHPQSGRVMGGGGGGCGVGVVTALTISGCTILFLVLLRTKLAQKDEPELSRSLLSSSSSSSPPSSAEGIEMMMEKKKKRKNKKQVVRFAEDVEEPGVSGAEYPEEIVSMVAPSATPAPSTQPPADAVKVAASAEDAAAAGLACTLLVLSLASVAFILHFHLRAFRRADPHPRPRLLRLRDLNSLWSVRILLAAFACLWSLAELLRLPGVRQSFLGRNASPEYPPSSRLQMDPCSFYVFASQGFAEPCFLATLLFLLHASVQGKASYPNAFATALALALLASLPFLVSYALFLAFAPWVLSRLGIPPEVFFGRDAIGFESDARCSYPLFSTVLLGGFGAVYVPWFVSTCWRAVAVVINKRLQIRLYALTSAVVVGITLQVTTLALSTFWSPGDPAFEGLALAAFLGVFFSAAVGEVVLVVYPIADTIDAVSWRPPVAAPTAVGDRGDGEGRTAHVSA